MRLPLPAGLGEICVGDVTYVATGEGWPCSVTVLDLLGWKVVGRKLGYLSPEKLLERPFTNQEGTLN